MITIEIGGSDKTSLVKFGSLNITDRINQATDVCNFIIQKFGDQTYRPNINDEVIITMDSERIYGGVIISVEQSMIGHSVIQYDVSCKDYTQYLDRKLVTERYEDTNIRDIIIDLNDRYGDDYGFTADVNVFGGDFEVSSIAFNEIPLTSCFNKLAQLTGYSWYVDYFKDIHFFKKNDEPAPFNLTDTSDNFIFDSLRVSEDLSQIRNKVKVRGGEARGEPRTKLWAGDGENDTFSTDNKFAEMPTVVVDGVTKTVGVDFINNDLDFDAMWNYQEKYIRFTAGNIPGLPMSGETNIEITGVPLSPIVVQKQDNPSVATYGVYEFVVFNDSLKTRDEALLFAQAQLQEYADTISEGGFQTYTPGLKSGQTITIFSDLRNLNEVFLIQDVRFIQQSPTEGGIWTVSLATLRSISLIDILQKLLFVERVSEGEDETLLNFFELADSFGVTDSIDAPVATDTEDYVWEQGVPGSDSYPNPIVWNKFTWH